MKTRFTDVQGLVQRLSTSLIVREYLHHVEVHHTMNNRAKGLLVNSKYKEIELKNRSLFLERYYFRFSSIKKIYRYSSITAITDDTQK